MRIVALLVLLLGLTASWAAARHDTAEYSIELDDDWMKARLLFVEHVAFTSEKHRASLKILSVEGRARPERLRYAARMILEEILGKERIQDPAVISGTKSTWQWGDGFASSCIGRDSRGRSFKYVVIVKRNKSVVLTFETPSDRESALDAISESALKRLSF